MCGISGIYSLVSEIESPLQIQKLRHRGPDSTGEWWSQDRRVWLGHTRLAIVDLSSVGNQPMIDPATGNVIVFNGEIYNHEQIRKHPLLQKVNWQGTSDTETLLIGYSIFGKQIVSLLKGMFAFIIWDRVNQQIFAARDRFGIKPFYYTYRSNVWSFSSETRLLESEGISKEGLSLYLRYGACQDEQLILDGVKVLPSGCTLTISHQNNASIEKYWPNTIDSLTDLTAEESKYKIRNALEVSVREHLLADVPVASFLSGGIDSSIVTALAAKYYPGTLKTFSLGFAQQSFDETAIAKKIADKWSTDHTRIELEPSDVCKWVKEAVTSMDLPSVDAINTYIISKAVKLHSVKVALSGLGGDEIFGGYPSFKDAHYLRLLSLLPEFVGKNIGRLGNKLSKVGDIAGQRVSIQTAALARRVQSTNLDLKFLGLPTPAFTNYGNFFVDSFGEVSWAELRGYMQNMLLRDNDQMSMAVSLETRVPFLDHQLVELCLALEEKAKRPTKENKSLLLEACRDLLIPEVYQRQKQGFTLPMNYWLRNELQDFSIEGLSNVKQYFPEFEKFLEKLHASFMKEKLHWTRLWLWVVLGHWLAQRNPL